MWKSTRKADFIDIYAKRDALIIHDMSCLIIDFMYYDFHWMPNLINLFQPPPPLHAPGYENNFHRKPINTHFFLLVKTIDSILFIISACHENANDHLLFSC